MKKMIFAGCLMAGASVFAQAGETDSLKVVNLQEVQIVSTRATSKTPVAFTNVSKEELKKQNFGQDIPFLLSMTPSALTTSDAGAGIGYTTLRVRGTDGTRINITTNGIPMNDAESHTLFWVNMPDFASSVKDKCSAVRVHQPTAQAPSEPVSICRRKVFQCNLMPK